MTLYNKNQEVSTLTTEQDEKAKAEAGKGQGDQGPENVEPVVKPELEEGEGEITPENALQQAKTFKGMLKKAQEELAELRQGKADFGALSAQLERHGETLNMMMEVLSSSVDLSEETQERIKKAQEAREATQRAYQQGLNTMSQIRGIYEAAGIGPEDEGLKDAKEAFTKGKYEDALRLTIVAVKGKIVKPSSQESDKDKEPAKPAVKVLTATSAPGKSVEEMTPTEKVKAGIAERDRKQGK